MCAQCMSAAAVAVGAAGGLRAWLGARRPVWLSPRRSRAVTVLLFACAAVAAALL